MAGHGASSSFNNQHSPSCRPSFPHPPSGNLPASRSPPPLSTVAQNSHITPSLGHSKSPLTNTLPPLNISLPTASTASAQPALDSSSIYHRHPSSSASSFQQSYPGSPYNSSRMSLPVVQSGMRHNSHSLYRQTSQMSPPHQRANADGTVAVDSVSSTGTREREPSGDHFMKSPSAKEGGSTPPSTRRANPMSFANILSGPTEEPPARAPLSNTKSFSSASDPKQASTPAPEPAPKSPASPPTRNPEVLPASDSEASDPKFSLPLAIEDSRPTVVSEAQEEHPHPPVKEIKPEHGSLKPGKKDLSDTSSSNGPSTRLKASSRATSPMENQESKESRMTSVKREETEQREPEKPQAEKVDNNSEKILVDDGVDNGVREDGLMSDIEVPGFEEAQTIYASRGRKRARELDSSEAMKRKKRRDEYLYHLATVLDQQVSNGIERFNRNHEVEYTTEIQQKDVEQERERKKDHQRRRRRENTVRHEITKMETAQEKAKAENDEAEKDKLLREVERARRKIKSNNRALGKEVSDSESDAPNELPPPPPDTAEAVSKQSSPPPTAAAKKKTSKGSSSRPKKSKEKKQSEIRAAEIAQAELDNEVSPKSRPVTPKDRKDKKDKKSAAPPKETTPPVSTFDTKGYNVLYEQIWRDIARKDIPKVFRIKTVSLSTRQENLRKTGQLASKQARKWQERTNKSTKDIQSRAKRNMREMMSFWKRNEREERDLRRLAEKQEMELAKKAESDREMNRQKRKLNFLISQTELYSHFIGSKIKTSEAEGAPQGAETPAEPPVPQRNGESAPVKNFDELDFDAEDESALQQAAMANAQNAVQAAQDRARAFNDDKPTTAAEQMAQMDEGELNFQNPTSLGDVEVSQPKMLTAQLKEYQLKGLNWLVNLYEQGINGILADEMGLGKTVQSISVMAYLAEVHNIWGPFLIIAPASTLHNWQQEISRFVPAIKVLPYWGSAKDRKVLRKFWDRRHITYTKDSEFHVLVTSYQLVVQDAQYFQKVKWQYMILDEAQAIKSSQSSRWKNLLAFHCRNRLLLTGTPIQNNMQELWALLHFIMPTLFDSHDEFSDWFSKDIESHAQSNTTLNEDQLRRLHMILKPFMLRRVKKHVQTELGDKVEIDVYCDLTYRQRALYAGLRDRISILDLLERASRSDDPDASTTTLMNLVMQFRKVCNHPDLMERSETTSPLSLVHFAETGSFVREGHDLNVAYSTRNAIEYPLPRLLCGPGGRLDIPGNDNARAGFESHYLSHLMNIWSPEHIHADLPPNKGGNGTFSWLRFAGISPGEAYKASHAGIFTRAVGLHNRVDYLSRFKVAYDSEEDGEHIPIPSGKMLNIVASNDRRALAEITTEGRMSVLLNVHNSSFEQSGLSLIEPCERPRASAPPITVESPGGVSARLENERSFFNTDVRHILYGNVPSGVLTTNLETQLLERKLDTDSQLALSGAPPVKGRGLLPEPNKAKARYTNISVPSMRRFVTDSGKLAKLDELLVNLKSNGHRVLLYFQMTRMMDLMEEYLTYRNYKYCRLDGSTTLEDRRDTVGDFQQRPEIFVFLLSTRAGGLGINLTAADTVIFYDSDWNPTIDSQAMDRAHRLGQTKQVTVYRLITQGTIEERIRKRATQKEEVQRVVISGGAGAGVDFNTKRADKTKDIAMWLADDAEVEMLEQREKEAKKQGEAKKAKQAASKKRTRKEVSLDDMYHEGEGHFDDASARQAGDASAPTEQPPSTASNGAKKRSVSSKSKRAKTTKERLQFIDGQ